MSWGRFVISTSELYENNCITYSTMKCLAHFIQVHFSKSAPDYMFKIHNVPILSRSHMIKFTMQPCLAVENKPWWVGHDVYLKSAVFTMHKLKICMNVVHTQSKSESHQHFWICYPSSRSMPIEATKHSQKNWQHWFSCSTYKTL